MKRLHITNGDAAIELLEAAKVQGDFRSWNDVLHMGPVPSDLSLTNLSKIRATFIADVFQLDEAEVARDFQARDSILTTLDDYDQVILWFEHDLYDQLQLIQVLDACAAHREKLWLINPGRHLTYHRPDEVDGLWQQRKPVSEEQVSLARRAWNAFRQSTPVNFAALLNQDTSSLPHLHNAVQRTLKELPDKSNGVSTTEWQILELLEQGPLPKGQLFRQYTLSEQDAFHGDCGFFWYLDQLTKDTPPLCQYQENQVWLTETGIQLLAGQLTWQRNYTEPQWLGGYCLSNPKHKAYYWDRKANNLASSDANL